MRAKELAGILLQHPEYEVSVSIDISTGEADADRRAFGDEVFEVRAEESNSRFAILFGGYVNTPPTADHTAAYHQLLLDTFIPAILNKALPPITGDLTTGKIQWRGVYVYYEQVSGHVERTWLQQRGERISPVIEFDLSTGEYTLTE